MQIYTNKIKSRIVFETKTSYKLALLGSTKKVVDRDKDREDLSKLESVDVVLVHYNLGNNSYQQASNLSFHLCTK